MTSQSLERLANSWRMVTIAWEDARAVWQDDVGADFERRCWEPLEHAMSKLFQAADALESALGEAEQIGD